MADSLKPNHAHPQIQTPNARNLLLRPPKFPPQPSSSHASANTHPSQPPSTTPTETRPSGGRKNKSPEEEVGDVANKATSVLPTGDMQIPGPSQDEDKSSLKIKIHLNIHAKVRLELDAQIYGDVVIGLL
ncbi:hypothetical protein N7462_010505 [Penicillium macrosclerotiorum]|uniref:uncharacterized protein n=1 Tax=Penicillium macrosclerotiorum TaxID=303699 RepID=UPI002547C926|nr:uncharacterized protein N7462_010505 [Penicillium macrosclerotiorum]KAJ5669435.1 hypothetical protein N7462_010505 [Penicillium macrosclerotiorum]